MHACLVLLFFVAFLSLVPADSCLDAHVVWSRILLLMYLALVLIFASKGSKPVEARRGGDGKGPKATEYYRGLHETKD